jgi:transcription elongation factor Elf1
VRKTEKTMRDNHKPTKAHCPDCDSETLVNVLGEQYYGYEEVDILNHTYALQCKGCKKLFLYAITSGQDLYIDFDYDDYRTDNDGIEEKIIITPTPKSKLKHLKKHKIISDMLLHYDSNIEFDKAIFVESIYNEISDAINTKKLILACLGMLSLLDILYRIKYKKYDTKSILTENLNDMQKNLYITERQKEMLKNVLAMGDAATHRDAVPTVQDIVACMQIIEHMVESFFAPATPEPASQR